MACQIAMNLEGLALPSNYFEFAWSKQRAYIAEMFYRLVPIKVVLRQNKTNNIRLVIEYPHNTSAESLDNRLRIYPKLMFCKLQQQSFAMIQSHLSNKRASKKLVCMKHSFVLHYDSFKLRKLPLSITLHFFRVPKLSNRV